MVRKSERGRLLPDLDRHGVEGYSRGRSGGSNLTSMRPLRGSLVLAACAAAGCGWSPPVATISLDVKGAPFRVAKPETALEPIGDVDAGEPPSPPLPVAPPAPQPSPPAKDEEVPTSFDDLASFEFPAGGSQERTLPESIVRLSGRRVVLDGYMMPLQYEAGGAKKFLLMRYRFGCCYAVSPQLNEWIEVTMDKGVADYIPDALSTVWGVLVVKEETREGATIGLYKMRASRAEISEAR